MISFDEAVGLVRSAAAPLGVETVAIGNAAGRVLATPVRATIDSPRRDVSAMDGYAVRDQDLGDVPARLTIVGDSFAGHGWGGQLGAGKCARIFTGAPVPFGADRVVMQEDVRRDHDVAIIETLPGPARHIRSRAADFAAGDELLPVRRLLDARAIVAAAAADISEVEVFRRARLRILSTGDELAEPGTARNAPDLIPDSVSFGVAAMAQQWGATCKDRARLRDDLASMRSAAVRAVDDADIVVVTGGASVGEKDFAKEMFAPLELIFSKVAMKPGKPVWFARARHALVLGLPGNPTSALVTARLFLAPLLALLQGRSLESALDWKSAPLGGELAPCGERETFHRGVMKEGRIEMLKFQESHAQRTLAEADFLVRQRAASPRRAPGDLVEVLQF